MSVCAFRSKRRSFRASDWTTTPQVARWTPGILVAAVRSFCSCRVLSAVAGVTIAGGAFAHPAAASNAKFKKQNANPARVRDNGGNVVATLTPMPQNTKGLHL